MDSGSTLGFSKEQADLQKAQVAQYKKYEADKAKRNARVIALETAVKLNVGTTPAHYIIDEAAILYNWLYSGTKPKK